MSATPAASRCDEGGEPRDDLFVRVPAGNPVDFRFLVCRSDALFHLFFDEQELVDTSSTEFPDGELNLRLPELSSGRHALGWTVFSNGPSWKTLLEVAVNGTVQRRDRKNHETTSRSYHGVVFLEAE